VVVNEYCIPLILCDVPPLCGSREFQQNNITIRNNMNL